NLSRVNQVKLKGFRIMVISDLNAGYRDTTYSRDVADVMARIPSLKPDLILCGGDMVAGQKATLTEKNILAMWRNFDRSVLKPIAALNIPFGFTLGNHDGSPNFKLDREMAKQFWTKNKADTHLDFVDSSHYPFYFSYIKQNVFMMSWDATGAKVPQEVYDWMKVQLGTPIAKKARLRILLGHLPLYAIVASKNKPGEVNANADSALNFFKENGIDLYISGHQHAYFPAHKNGVQLLNLGCIGDGPRPILGHQEPAKKAFTIIEIPAKSPKNFTYHTWMPTSPTELKLESLPDSIVGFNGTVRRRDKM
ncbi:MAG: metallophosphoesterase, partial [Pedobacter sp.]|nr:metallophosphoesterase [Pedobacter sp.]